MDIIELQPKSLEQLRVVAREWEIPAYSKLKKDDLILRLLRANAEKQGFELRGGVLEIVEDGIGFLRAEHLMPGIEDIYVSQTQIRRLARQTPHAATSSPPDPVTPGETPPPCCLTDTGSTFSASVSGTNSCPVKYR